MGKLSIETGKPYSEKLKESFPEPTPDHRILAICEVVKEKKKGIDVILVSKDINLRMKAKSLGILAQDYKNDQVTDVEKIHKDIETIENIDDALISKFYESREGIDIKEINGILAKLKLKVDDLLRSQEKFFKENIKNKNLNDDEKIELISKEPKLLRRPVIIKDKKAVIGDPPENIKDIL